MDQLWRSPSFPMWLTLAVAGFFGLVAIITLARAERSVPISAVMVGALLAVGIGAAATVRGFAPGGLSAFETSASLQPIYAAVPALSCI
ncbi:MAG TPA: hypothetical protein VKB08_21685, partial [Bradyrhizobium sp.]|nr:hypothetical protein [Bradyrhizobium sp.]